MTQCVFIDRRSADRRTDQDPCKDMDLDLYHRKRRKKADRRAKQRSILEDYEAFHEKYNSAAPQPYSMQYQ